MRRLRFYLICLAIITMTSCQESLTETSVNSAQGGVEIALTAESHVTFISKADTDEDVPDADDFTVEIFKTDGDVRLYRDTYANTSGSTIYLNVGDYRLLASYGDSLGVGFDAAYYAASQSFTVEQQTTTVLSLTAKLANVKVAVNYGENLVADYTDFYAVLRARESEDYELTFTSDETRAGYLPAGSLTFELYAYENETWKSYSYSAGDFSGNDFVTINVDTTPAEGELVLNLSIDSETDLVEDEITVPYSYLATVAPSVSYTGLDGSDIEVIEGVETASVEAVANIVAYGEIANCYLNIDSDYITTESTAQTASLSLMSVSESQIDLANIDDETAAILNAAGITWMKNMKGKTLSYVDFSGVPEYIASQHYNADAPSTAFSLTIVDAKGNTTTSDSFSVTSVAPTYSLNGPADEADIWGWKIMEQSITYDPDTCNPDMIELQYYEPSTEEWVVVSDGTDDGNGTITYGTVSGLTAGTDYTFRGVYNGGSYAVENVISTEDPDQVGNASLDEWNAQTWSSTSTWGTETYDWWQPWSENETDAWWAVNSKVSMPATGGWASNIYYRCFPCVGYSVEYGPSSTSGYSAIIAVVRNGWTNASGSVYTGELFIGTADDDGAHESDGHSFSTRPSKITFDYYYYSKNSETGSVEFNLYASDGTVISTYSDTAISDTNSGWATYTATLDYDYTNLKASEIYMSFKASTASSPSTSDSAEREFAGTTYSILGGSYLRIDNIQLIYTDPDAE